MMLVCVGFSANSPGFHLENVEVLHNFSSCGSVKLTSSVYGDDGWIQHHNLKMHFYTFTKNTVDFQV